MLPSRLAPSTLTVFLALLTLAPLVSSTLAHDVAPVARREHLRMIRTFAAAPELPRRDVPAQGSVNAASAPVPAGSDSSTTPAGTSAAATGKGTNTATTDTAPQTSAGTSVGAAGPSTGAGAITTGAGTSSAGTATGAGAGTGTGAASPTGSGDTSGSGSGSGGLLGGLGGLLGGPSSPVVSVGPGTASTPPSTSPSVTNGVTPTDVGNIGTKTPPTSASTSSDSSSAQSTSQSASSADQSTTPPSSPSDNKVPKQTIIILVVIASSIVAAGIIWTVIRKWKFRPSSDFEGRLAPIDWQPSRSDEDMSQRRRPLSFTSHSSGAPTSDHAGIRRDVFAPDFPPAHDFTALGGGYARGPSPQPPLARGPSSGRGGYSGRGY